MGAGVSLVSYIMCTNSQTVLSARRRRDGELFSLAMREAEKHKWIESEKAGRDLGEAALWDWSRRHWWRWCRDRWIEHLSGERYWGELDHDDFGLLKRNFHHNTCTIEHIVTQIKSGAENLNIIQWALDNKQDMRDVVEILNLLDINSRRISFWPT